MLSFVVASGGSAHRGFAAGTSTALGVGGDASPGATIGVAQGTSSVIGIAGATSTAVGAAAGVATVNGIGGDASPGATAGAASGVATAAAIGRAMAAGRGASAGLGSVLGHGARLAGAAGTASGIATVIGITDVRGIAAGVATVTGIGGATAASAGAAAGSSAAAAVGGSIAAAVGAAAGTSTATGVGGTVSVTKWDTAITGRGPDFAFSNGDLTVVGKPVTLAIAVDLDNKRMWGRVGKGAWSGTSGNPATNTGGNDITSVVSGNVFPAWSPFNLSATTINTGAAGFEGAVPSGFSAWGGTWDSGNKDASITLSNGSLTATGTASSSWKSIRGTQARTSGKWYFELSADFVDTSNGWMGGIENASGTLSSYIGSTANGAGYQSQASFWLNGGNPGPNLPASVTKFSNAWRSVRSTTSHISGKYYVELTCDVLDVGSGWMGGVTNGSGPLLNFIGSDNNSCGFQAQQWAWKNNNHTGSDLPNALTATHVLCLAIDLDNNKIWGRVDGNAWSGTSGNPATNTAGNDIASVNDGVGVYLGFSGNDNASFDQATLNAGATAFSQTPPAGFGAW